MPETDYHKDTPQAVRMPDGMKARVKAAASEEGETVNGFIVAAIEERLERREGGSTAPAGNRRGGTTTRPAPPPATFSDGQPQQAPRRAHAITCKCGICKPDGGKR